MLYQLLNYKVLRGMIQDFNFEETIGVPFVFGAKKGMQGWHIIKFQSYKLPLDTDPMDLIEVSRLTKKINGEICDVVEITNTAQEKILFTGFLSKENARIYCKKLNTGMYLDTLFNKTKS